MTHTEAPPPPAQNKDTSALSVRWLYALGAAAFLLLIFGPYLMTSGLGLKPAARLALETQIRDVGAKFLWAGISFVGAIFVWQYLQNLARVVENSAQTLAAAERTAFFAAQASETERYARAMALLGDGKIEVRLGGIYALERLARESARDHGPIMEVLAATVRQHSAWHDGEVVPARPGADLQAILTVIGRRHAPFDAPESHIDLHGTALARAYLPWANLERAHLYETNLDGAVLQGANLRGAWMWKSRFAGAILDGAHLEGADLRGASGLTKDQVCAAHFDHTTKLPDHLRAELVSGPRRKAETQLDTEDEGEDLSLPTKR
jgi:hypothetical protein